MDVSGEGHNFFNRLAGLENTREVLAAFDQIVNRPIGLASPDFFAHLYRVLIDHLLQWLELPAGPGAAMREWKALYGLAAGIDPYYLTAQQIARQLDECPSMGAGQREVLTQILLEYFKLRREEFPANFPSPLVDEADCARWSAVFPADPAWRPLDVLQAVGLYAAGTYAGCRAWTRFEEGVFEPPGGAERFKRWRALCHGGASEGERGQAGYAQRRDFLAAVFAGAFGSLNLPGYCGEVPRCVSCPLNDECRWARGAAKDSRETGEILGRLGQGRLAHLGTAQLMQAVFGLAPKQGEALAARLDGTSLRRLAGKTHQELVEWLAATGLEPERLRGLFELGRRFSEESLSPGVRLVSGREVFHHFRMRLRDLKQEQFLVVLLDAKRCFLGDVMVSQGTLSTSPVHPREVFNMAVREHAASVLIVHNHPSGDPAPSRDDIQITKRLAEAGKVMGIPVLDHIIIAGESYVSFLEQDMM